MQAYKYQKYIQVKSVPNSLLFNAKELKHGSSF